LFPVMGISMFSSAMNSLFTSTVKRMFRPRERFRIVAMESLAPRVARIRLEPESGSVRLYYPGQFLFVRFTIPGLPGREKAFTISNPPGSRFLEVMVKGINDWTLALYDKAKVFPGQIGQAPGMPWTALVDYPHGNFTTENASPGPWVFLADGIGIVPFLAMAGSRLRDDARILILWSASNRDELAGFDELSAINARRSSIRLVPVLDHDPMWTGRRGLLDRQALEELAGSELADPETRYWICCPAPLRLSLHKALKSLGVSHKRIRHQDCAS
jgi:ferredoxin-NADP reductase